MSNSNKLNKWMWFLIFLYIVFIWSNSLQPGDSSGSLSQSITQILLRMLSYVNISFEFEPFHHFIRKLAHFSEYAILGNLVMMALYKEPLLKNKTVNYVLFLLFPASLDEGIQHFVPGRYGTIYDVFIDLSGFLFGSFVIYIFYKLTHKKATS